MFHVEQINLTKQQIKEHIQNLANKLFLNLDDQKINNLAEYFLILKEKNLIINLVSRKANDLEILDRHFYSSLIFVKEILQLTTPANKNIADVGTGGGFPGMICGICIPEASFTLIDSIGKKISFLDEVKQNLELKNIHPTNTRVETAPRLNKQFDIVTARAMAHTYESIKYCMPLLKKNGVFITIKTLNQLQEVSELVPRLKKQNISTKISQIEEQIIVEYKIID